MKKKFVIIGLLAAALSARGQIRDSTYQKKRVKETDVQLLLSYYTQDNNHSAVTGGIGTEDLQVYAAQVSFDTRKDSVKGFHLDLGVDIISSASTDNIDFEMSSASKVDARSHFGVGKSWAIKKSQVGITGAFSIESDYTSLGGGLNYSHVNNDRSRQLSISFQAYFDDLRWGRLENGKPQHLVYPEELNNEEWFDIYRRNSYNLMGSFYQAINKRMALALYPGLIYQSGLLSTPFHRVYFLDDSERVEKLPTSRFKVPFGVQLNSFVGGRTIIQAYYRFYWDDFGINAQTASIEVPVKFSRLLTISPFIRIYSQTAADYFKPYAQHDPSQPYYTSDYDLSNFYSSTAGVGVRYAPFSGKRRTTFEAIEIRYSFYDRSDGLTAHMVSLFLKTSTDRSR